MPVFHASRRTFLKGAAAAAAALTANRAMPSFAADGALRLATYGGSWRDAIAKDIAPALEKDGIKLDYILGNPDDNLAKLIAAKRQRQSPFELFESSPLFYKEAIQANLYDKIDYSKVSAQNIPSWAREDYQMTPIWAPEGIVYNADKFKELGISPFEHYGQLADPKLRGHVAFPDPSHVHHWAAVVGLAMENGGSEADMSKAIAAVNALQPNYFYTSSVELGSKFTSGEIWAAPWGAGWAVRLKRGGAPIAVSYPKFGTKVGSLWPCPISIIKDSPNRAHAERYLAEWLKEEGPSAFSIATGAVPVASSARLKMRQDAITSSMLRLSDNDIDNGFRVNWSDFDTKKWREAWNREIKR